MRISDFGWETINGWSIYPFNFTGSLDIPVGEINELRDVILDTFVAPNRHIRYLWKDHSKDMQYPGGAIECVTGDGLILNISSLNSGHALSEITSFLNFYINSDKNFDWVAVPSSFRQSTKFIFALLCQFIPRSKIKIVNHGIKYKFESITLRRNRWFNPVVDWRSIKYTKTNNMVEIHNLHYILKILQDSVDLLVNLSNKIYKEESVNYTLSKKILALKMSSDQMMVTPDRAIYMAPSVREIATENGFQIFDIRKITDIEEYICVLYHAKIVIFSYGAIAATNRFFLNADCTVILLANKRLKSEYDHGNELCHPLH